MHAENERQLLLLEKRGNAADQAAEVPAQPEEVPLADPPSQPPARAASQGESGKAESFAAGGEQADESTESASWSVSFWGRQI